MNTKKTRLLSILFAFVLSMTGVDAFAHDIAVANSDGKTIYYVWSNNNTELLVSYRGDSKDSYSNEYTGNVVIPSTVKYNGKTYRVTSIGGYAFYNCSGLTSVTIPNNVTSIDLYAFSGCTNLNSVTIPNSVTSIGLWAFEDCSGLTSVTIPNSVTTIDNYAFSGCSGLTSITIPNSVTYIGHGAISGCSGLTSVTIPNSVTTIESNVFSSCHGLTSITIPSSVTTIEQYAFNNCTSLKYIIIPNSVTSIGSGAFNMCNSLTSVKVGMKTPPTIESNTFSNRANATLYVPAGCKAAYEAAKYWKEFKQIVVPINFDDDRLKLLCLDNWDSNHDGELSEDEAAVVTDLGSVFSYEENITSFNELQYFTGLTSIGNSAFEKCYELRSITIPNSVTSIGNSAFRDCYELRFITIPNSVTSIGNRAFEECYELRSITIPNSVTSTGSNAFYGTGWYDNQSDGVLYLDNWLVGYKGDNPTGDLIIPDGTTGIAKNAFSYCSGLTSVAIPNSVTSIGDLAFHNCSGLTSIIVENENSSYISEDGVLFDKDKNTLLCFPAGKTQPTYTIPETVTNIYSYAFAGCNITSVTIPNSVTSIGNYAFNGCTSLTSVTVEMETPLTIAEYTFSNRANSTLYVPAGCKAAYETANYWKEFKAIVEMAPPSPAITFANANVKAICVQNWDTDGDGELSEAEAAAVTDLGTVFKENKTITSFDELQYFTGLTNIADEAFYYCSALTSITIPNSVTRIGLQAFRYCYGLTTVSIPESVTNIDNMAFFACTKLASVTIPESVTSIGQSAFYSCSALTSVVIPNSVTTIKEVAFSNCSSLTSIIVDNNTSYIVEDGVLFNKNKTSLLCYPAGKTQSEYTIPESVTRISSYAFDGCSALTSVTIPNSVTTFGQAAFRKCSDLTSVTIPESVTSIGKFAFQDCSSLTSVTVEMETPLTIESATFTNRANATLYVPASCKAAYEAAQYWQDFNIVSLITFADANVKAICVQNWDTDGDGELSEDEAAAVTDLGEVFKNNTTITSFDELQYFTGLTNIGDNAFNYCSAMTSVTFPNSLTSIGKWSFQYCSGLTSIIIPNSVKSIGVAAFHRCNGLTSVTIPESVTSIDYAAFSDCTGLTSIIVENGNNYYISEDGVLFDKDKKSLLCFPAGKTQSTYTIPESVTKIYAHAFERCSNLTFVTIPDNVTSIGKFAFRASGLTSVTIPNSVTTIGERVFLDCSSLTSVTIPNSVTTIGWNAFGNCTSLTSVSIPSSVTSIGESAFNGCTNLTSVMVEMETPLTIAENTFSNRTNATLYVPAGCKAAYKAAQYWQDFNIVELSPVITFADANVKALCVQNWDTDGDGELSEAEAAAVTDLGEVFKNNTTITSFNELQYFTGLTNIGISAFYHCSSLTSVTIPNSVTTIESFAFEGCKGLTSITIPNSVASIGNGTFQGCNGLTSVTIPGSVTSIGYAAFSQCISLTSIIVEDGNNSYISEDGVLFNYNKTSLLCYPAGKTESTYTIPNSVTSIGRSAFNGCSKLTSVTIPESVTNIGQQAFRYCSNLSSVTVEMGTPLTIESETFTNRANATLYVPAGCKAAYEAAEYWQDFNIVEMESSLEPTDISQIDNVIYMEPQEVPIGSRGTLSFKMKNNAPIRGFQFDLYLPEGMTVATSSNGKVEASLNATKLPEGDSHLLTASIQDGFVRFLCSSQYDENFATGDDIMMTLKVNVSEDMTEGEYPIELKTVKLSETDVEKYYLTELVRSKVIVGSYLLGDVNADGVVDISDYISIANYIHGYSTNNFIFKAGDVNGDGEVDISDYISVANIIHTGSPSGNSQAGAKTAVFMTEESQELDPE